jgi:tetratricopeptide (TPR) repeat protein
VPSERAFLTSLARVALMLLFAGENAAAERLASRVEEHVAERPPSDALALAAVHRLRANRANARGDVGTYASELALATLAFERAGDLRNACNASATAAHASMELGCHGDAVLALRRALELSSRLGLPTVNALAKHNLGLALARTGELGAGRALEAEALALLEAQGDQRLAAGARIYLAMIEGLGGRLDEAERALAPAMGPLASLPGLLAYALAVRARLHLEAGRAPEALADAREGMRILDELGGLEEGESLLRLVHVEALEACGERDLAREALAQARARVHDRASRIVDPAARESFLTRVPANARLVRG